MMAATQALTFPSDLFPSNANSQQRSYVQFASYSFKGGQSASHVVNLIMPQDIDIKYDHSWDSSSLAGLGGALGETVSDLLQGNSTATSGVTSQIGSATSESFKKLVAGEAGVSVMDVKAGSVLNNRMALTYKGSGLRTLSLKFDFFPQSEKESITAVNIINSFKDGAASPTPAPTTVQGQANASQSPIRMEYPDLWQITFSTDSASQGASGGQNYSLFSMGKSALTSIDVNYTPDGVWAKLPNGVPTHMTLGLSFSELAPVSRVDSSSGGNNFKFDLTSGSLGSPGW